MNWRSLVLLLFWVTSFSASAEITITPSDVYAQVVQLDKETHLLMQQMDVKQDTDHKPITLELKPRHVWQKTYFILVKINAFRRKNDLPINSINALEPVLQLDPALVYEQTQRLLTEVRIIKKRLAIEEQISEEEVFFDKKPIDVFNRLHEISLHWEMLNLEAVSPSLVFAEVMRIYEDINTLLRLRKIQDNTFPPEKHSDVTPKQSLEAAFGLMDEIQRLQRSANIVRTDFSVFSKKTDVLPSDVFNMVGMSLAELQTIKAQQDLRHSITPPANFYTEKTPADVHQLLHWTIRKLRLIQTL